jgi:hypothetical protein
MTIETQGNESTEVTAVESSAAEVVQADNTASNEKTEAPSFDKLRKAADTVASGEQVATKETKTKAAPAPQYTPNFKFKVMDKEHEFDEWLKGVVKDPDTEKKARELYEKAYGLDSVKADRQTLKASLAEANEKVKQTEQYHNTLNSFLQSKDYDSFFENVSIPKEDIVRYALEIVKRESDPQLKAQWDNQRTAKVQGETFEQKQRELAENTQQFAVQQRNFELDVALSSPDIAAFSQAFDASVGKPGAFKDHVIQTGAAHSAAYRKDLSVKEAVETVMNMVRAINPSLAQTGVQQAAKPVVAASQKPVIPTVNGSGGSPVVSKMKSFSDLKKRSAELEAQA